MKKINYPKSKIKLQTFASFADYIKAVRQRKLMTHQMGWGLDYPDAENVLQLYYGPNESPGSNSANYKNKAYDEIYKKISTMQASQERTKFYKQANKMLIEDCVVISGFSRTRVHLWHKNILMYPNRDVLGNYFKYIGSNVVQSNKISKKN